MARVVVLLDRRQELALLPMHDDEATPLLAPLPPEERFASWHLVLADGALAGHGRGVVELLRSMHLTRAAGSLLAVVPDRLLDTLYNVLARHRGSLGRLVPNGPAPRHFP